MSSALNVITAAFGGLREVTTAPLWQWDYGQILEITGLDLPQAFEVHFSNSRKSGETITQIGTDSQVVIPDMYLTSGADIYCFIFLHDGLTDGETEYVIKIPVRERPEPSDIEPTPEQQDVITEAIAALNDAVEQTGEDKAATAALAEAAAASSLIATQAAQNAQGSATSASASASTASTAAATATTKASEAATSAANAASAKTAAETAETNARAAQTASESAKASAESAAQTATAKASEAAASAASVGEAAQTATAKAAEASASATSASGSATAAAGSATTASTKASEASASATAAQAAQTAAEAAQTAAETAQGKAEDAKGEAETTAQSIAASAAQIATNTADITQLKSDKADIIISTAEGAIATFEDGGADMPMVSCVAKIEPVQSGSGDPSPDNVRPISGWTSANVQRTGKNLFDSKFSDYSKPYDYYIKPIKLEFGKRYVLKAELVGTAVTGTAFGLTKKGDRYSDFAPYLVVTASGTVESFEITIDDTFTSPKLVAYASGQAKFDEVMSNYNITLEVKAAQNNYEPYKGESVTIPLGQTVYGGTLDVVSGVLTVDMAIVDLGTLTWTYITGDSYAGSPYFATGNVEDKKAGSNNMICSQYAVGVSRGSIQDCVITPWNSTNALSLACRDDRFTDAATFKTAMDGVQLVYELATPITYQLTPTEVRTLLGLNNVWADTGDVEVQYRVDTKLYIDGKNTDFSKLIAPTEADYKATRAYTSGNLLIVGSQLYKATTSIANGATLTVGTNITATTLAEVIAAL